MHATVQVRKSEDNLQEPVFVSLQVGGQDWRQPGDLAASTFTH